MIPTAVIMAIAVASAPTSTEVLRSDPSRLREASNEATPSFFSKPPDMRNTALTTAGIANVPAAIASSVAKYPKSGFPATGGAFDAVHAIAARTSEAAKSRDLYTRARNSFRPRAIASTGGTWAASHAGA